MDEQLISGLEKLARLQLTETERIRLSQDLERMLQLVGRLRELDTEGVEPLVHLSEAPDPGRPDEPGAQISREQALQNAPKHDGQFFQTPKVIE